MRRGTQVHRTAAARPRAVARALVAAVALPIAAACVTGPEGGNVEPSPGLERALRLAPPPPAAPVCDERLGFGVSLAGLPVGQATLATTLLPTEGDDGADVDIVAEGGTNALLDVFYAVHAKARARIGGDGASRSFFLEVDENGKQSARALTYRATPCLYYKPWDDEPWVAILAQFRAPIDPLALLMKLRRLDPDLAPHDFEVAMTMRSFCYRARCVERRTVRVPAGEFADAWIWHVEVRPYERLGPEETAAGATTEVGTTLGFYEVAISADGRRLPLRLERGFGFGQVELELRSAEHDAAPTVRAGLSE
jgi:hypothetical protein